MLSFAYYDSDSRGHGRNIDVPEENKASAANLRHCIALYRVADKYDFPDLLLRAARAFSQQMSRWKISVKGMTVQQQSTSIGEFCTVVDMVYNLPSVGLKHPLAKELLVNANWGSMKVFGTDGRKSKFLVQASSQVPEFGRDLFLTVMNRAARHVRDDNGKRRITELGVLNKVSCPHCGEALGTEAPQCQRKASVHNAASMLQTGVGATWWTEQEVKGGIGR